MVTRLFEHVVDLVLYESQCWFRRGLSTIDMIFVARQLLENCREQHQDLYLAFVDQTRAFDIVNRDLLLNILRKFGCHPTFISMLQQFHTGMCAQVVMAGSKSSNFPVEVGVKQGCVLAPIIFNLLLVAITLVSHRDLQSSDCVGIEYCLDGGGGGGVDPIPCVSTHRISDPRSGPAQLLPHTSSSAATPTGSVHKSQTVSVVGMSGQLKRCNESWFMSLQRGQFAAGWLAGSILCR